jgi:hypothetical protein
MHNKKTSYYLCHFRFHGDECSVFDLLGSDIISHVGGYQCFERICCFQLQGVVLYAVIKVLKKPAVSKFKSNLAYSYRCFRGTYCIQIQGTAL